MIGTIYLSKKNGASTHFTGRSEKLADHLYKISLEKQRLEQIFSCDRYCISSFESDVGDEIEFEEQSQIIYIDIQNHCVVVRIMEYGE